MDWLGLGILIIGLAFLALVVLLIKPLKNLSELFSSLQKTTDELPAQVADVTSEATTAISAGKKAVDQLHEQMKELSPIFDIIGNIGDSTSKLSSSLLTITAKMKENTPKGTVMERYHLEGLYGAAALGYCLFQRQKRKA